MKINQQINLFNNKCLHLTGNYFMTLEIINKKVDTTVVSQKPITAHNIVQISTENIPKF